jgi:hypothetical protein
MRSIPVFVAPLALLVALSGNAGAEEFRIETDVFVDEETKPVVETLTIFSDGIVYDFLQSGVEEITLFDRQRKRLVLMDTQRRVKTELSTDSILGFVAQMQAHLNEAQRAFLLAEQLEVKTEDPETITLSNDRVAYHAKGQSPTRHQAAMEYQQFADWYARLNAMRIGNLPPFARIRLNDELAKRNLIPVSIQRTVTRKHGLKEITQTLHSQHEINWRLSVPDRRLIDKAGTCMAAFPTVSFREYLQLPEVVASKPVD